MPSRTVPMFSNSAENSHMTHCDMPWRRITSAAETAMAPAVIDPGSHSQMPRRRRRTAAGSSSP